MILLASKKTLVTENLKVYNLCTVAVLSERDRVPHESKLLDYERLPDQDRRVRHQTEDIQVRITEDKEQYDVGGSFTGRRRLGSFNDTRTANTWLPSPHATQANRCQQYGDTTPAITHTTPELARSANN